MRPQQLRQRSWSRILNLLISSVVAAADSLWRTFVRLWGVTPESTCVVLYYHDVPSSARQRFAHQLDMMSRIAEPIRLDRLETLQSGHRYVAVTFDDGLHSVVENAIPELEKRSIPSTHFIVADALGRTPDWQTFSSDHPAGDRVISADQLRALSSSPLVTIGSHTLTHPVLPSLTMSQAVCELSESRLLLKRIVGKEIDLFSFPYGAFDRRLVDWCANAGYERVFTTLPFLAFSTQAEYVTGRVTASPADSDLEYRLKVRGAYRWLPYAIAVKGRSRFHLNRLGSALRAVHAGDGLSQRGDDHRGL
jgi:peptidoglycan/xylan/chitin deacetylase (PgdA/CDA1 family)